MVIPWMGISKYNLRSSSSFNMITIFLGRKSDKKILKVSKIKIMVSWSHTQIKRISILKKKASIEYQTLKREMCQFCYNEIIF